ncbi:MAG: proline dehydrogenase family protein [Bacteroidetes bacterium]|nr:proline dehydrogenase family protein [Bacteroidota bacterium]
MELNFNNTEIAFSAKANKEMKLAHFLFGSMAKPWLTKMGIRFTKLSFALHLPIKSLIKTTIFKQFCGGETLEEANTTALHLAKYDIGVIMDYGVEGKSEEAEFEKTTETFLKTISFAADKDYIPFISLKITGFARFELLEKLHEGLTLTQSETEEAQRVFERIDKICAAAAKLHKMILIDAEESWIQKPVDDFTNQMMQKYNQHEVIVFNTFQMYRNDRYQFLQDSLEKAKLEGYQLGAKLVRGAYMEKERARALANHYPSPIHENKAATDKDFDRAVTFCLQHTDRITLFVGTHNENSNMHTTQIMQQQAMPNTSSKVYFSQLYGMSDNISFNLAKAGYHVSKYLPYGPVEDVIPYLMRRAEENTSVAGQTGRELSLIRKELERRKLKA